jgi:hypothetical protein
VVVHRRLAALVAAGWWGVLTGLAFVAVPLLFARLGSPAVAGPVAATLFSVLARLSMVCGAAAVVYLMFFSPSTQNRSRKFALFFAILAVVAAACQEMLVADLIVHARATGGHLRLWHGLGSLLVFTQWLAALGVSWVLLARVAETPAHCPP